MSLARLIGWRPAKWLVSMAMTSFEKRLAVDSADRKRQIRCSIQTVIQWLCLGSRACRKGFFSMKKKYSSTNKRVCVREIEIDR